MNALRQSLQVEPAEPSGFPVGRDATNAGNGVEASAFNVEARSRDEDGFYGWGTLSRGTNIAGP